VPGTSLHHYRSARQESVDLVLEDARGVLLGIKVKASSRMGRRKFRNLRAFGEALGDRFIGGVVLHSRSESISFGWRLRAVPVSALWRQD